MFNTPRDIKLFETINKELITEMIQTPLIYYKLDVNNMKVNIYGEAEGKVNYFPAIELYGLIEREDKSSNLEENGLSYTRSATFSFLRQTLKEANLYPEEGDIIYWDDTFFSVDNILENQYLGGKNNDTNITVGDNNGKNYSIVVETHQVRSNLPTIE